MEERLSRIEKKLDKILNLQTKIAKTLHLIPVTEKEEREIQILRDRNARQSAKVYEEREDMQNRDTDSENLLTMIHEGLSSDSDVYSDIFAEDVLNDFRSTKEV